MLILAFSSTHTVVAKFSHTEPLPLVSLRSVSVQCLFLIEVTKYFSLSREAAVVESTLIQSFVFLCLSTGEPLVVEAMKNFAELTDQARLVCKMWTVDQEFII